MTYYLALGIIYCLSVFGVCSIIAKAKIPVDSKVGLLVFAPMVNTAFCIYVCVTGLFMWIRERV